MAVGVGKFEDGARGEKRIIYVAGTLASHQNFGSFDELAAYVGGKEVCDFPPGNLKPCVYPLAPEEKEYLSRHQRPTPS